jgi:hypothetical protein
VFNETASSDTNYEAMTLNIFYECIRYLLRATGDIFCTHRKTQIPRKSVQLSRDSCVRVRHCVVENTVMQIRSDQTERQCTYKVTLKRVRVTIVAVEKQRALHNLRVCARKLSYPACNAHPPYCHLWPAPLYNIFPHYLIHDTIFERKKYLTQNTCFDFL